MTDPDMAVERLTAATGPLENLARHQQQLDGDGVMVGVSRQALDETIKFTRDLLLAWNTRSTGAGEDAKWTELAAAPEVLARVIAGQKFNAYETAGEDMIIAIGPVTNALTLARTRNAEAADLIVAALRIATGQQPCLAALSSKGAGR